MMPDTNNKETSHGCKEDNSKHIIIGPPTDNDVLCGRGGTCFLHEGNRRFRGIVAASLQLYLTTSTRSEKSKIVRDIVEEVLGQGVRFLKPVGACGWYEADVKTARLKVGHALRDASTDKSRHIKEIHLDLLRKKSKKTKQICNKSTKLSVVEFTNHSFGNPSVPVSNNFDNYDRPPMDAVESQGTCSLEIVGLEIVDPAKNELSNDWNFSDGLYDDLTNLSARSSLCGSFDDYLEIVNDMDLDELDEYLARATARESRHEWMRNEVATANYRFRDDNDASLISDAESQQDFSIVATTEQ